MASPAALAGISIGTTAAGSLISAYGQKKQGEATGDMYSFQAGVAQFNKKIAEQNRDYAYKVGESEATTYGIKARAQGGAIKAAQSGSNLDVNSGSAVDVRESQKEVSRMDLATIRNNAARVAYGYSVEATSQDLQSQLYGKAAANARAGGNIAALGSLISGASSVSSKWLQASQAGIIPPGGNPGGGGLLLNGKEATF